MMTLTPATSLLITTIEIALVIVLPLILVFRRMNIGTARLFLYVVSIYVVWYATYSMIHELRHLLPAWFLGERVSEIQLFPRIFSGELDGGHITTQYSGPRAELIIVAFPYLTDVLFVALGVLMLKYPSIRRSAILSGVLFTVLIASPAFDVLNNYIAYLLGAKNDFNAIAYSSGGAVANIIGSVAGGITVAASYLAVAQMRPVQASR